MIDYELTSAIQGNIDHQAIKTGLAHAATKLNIHDKRLIQIELVTPEESRQLNKTLRGKNEPTDCISISTQESHVGEQIVHEHEGEVALELKQRKELTHTWPVIGQLVICLDIVKENAAQACQPVERELEWVVEHGVLHVMGFHHDHDD